MAKNSEADVLVIGAGMAGAAISKRLSDAGIRVVCLEQGPWVHPAEYVHYREEWELARATTWAWDPNVRRLPQDYPVTGDTISPYMYNAVGGSTIHYAGHWPRFKPSDFRKGTEHGLGNTADWPITYEDLASFYDINDSEMGISGIAGDPANPPKPGRQTPPIPPGKLGMKITQGFEKLGWHWWPSDNAIITQRYDGRLPCNFCGNCLGGCPRGSLGTPDVTYWPKALRNGVDLRPNSRVERIAVGRDGRAKGAEYIDLLTGARHEQRAKVVVVCCNGIGTPRLLLNSATGRFPRGLANSSGQVGRNLMHHAWAFVDCWFDEPIEGYKGAFGAPLYSQEFYETDPKRGFVNGFTLQVGRSFGSAYTALGTHTGLVAPWGKGHIDFVKRHFAHHVLVFLQAEDLPVGSNRVTLDPVVKDSSGIPAARVEYKLPSNDERLLLWGIERINEVAEAAGAVKTNHTGPMQKPPGWHLMGTCRMGSDPKTSVTNKWHQTWDVPNLFICDGSSLVTGAAVNPTSTIGAMAVRCAEYIKRRQADILSAKKTPVEAAL